MNKKLTETEIKHRINKLVRDRLTALELEDIEKTFRRLNISIQSDVISQLHKISKKRTNIYYELYKDNRDLFGFGPSETEELLNLSKYNRVKLDKSGKLPVATYFACEMFKRKTVYIPMYDAEFVLKKVGTDYVEKELNKLLEVSKKEALARKKAKKQAEKQLTKVDREIERIIRKNKKILKDFTSECDLIFFTDNEDDLLCLIKDFIIKDAHSIDLKSSNFEKTTIAWNKSFKLIKVKELFSKIMKVDGSKRRVALKFNILIKESKDVDIKDQIIIEVLEMNEIKPDIFSDFVPCEIDNKIIIFDTETSGLSPGFDEICQLSYVILDADNIADGIKIARNFYFTVKSVNPRAEDVHGLSFEVLRERSFELKFEDYAEVIYRDFNNANLIAHNIDFDYSFIRNEFKRLDRSMFKSKGFFCTMNEYTDILCIERFDGTYKWPTLSEVVDSIDISSSDIELLVKQSFDNIEDDDLYYHDSRYDVISTYFAFINFFRKHSNR